MDMSVIDSRRERKKQETRQRLLETAWCLFREQGYEETTVADITEAADVAKGTFFNYFPTKESIVDQIALWRIDLLGEHVLGTADAPDSAVGRIKLMLEAMASEFDPEQDLARHMYLARVGAPVHHESAHRIGSLMNKLVVQGQATGEIRTDVAPGLVARMLLTSWFYHYSRCWHAGEEYPDQTRLIQSVDILMEGLRGDDRRQG
jgi:NADH dehydrogenase